MYASHAWYGMYDSHVVWYRMYDSHALHTCVVLAQLCELCEILFAALFKEPEARVEISPPLLRL